MSQTKERSALDAFTTMNAPGDSDEKLPAVVEPKTLAILSRSEIDAQLATAVANPRSMKNFRATVLQIATTNEDIAADCVYSLPARKDGDDPIEGPSIRWTEILQYAWHNSRVGARVIDEAFDHVTAQGVFHDVETNTVSTFEVRRRITGKTGRRYSPDMINVTANAACSIAKRNAILAGIPRPLWWDLFEQTKKIAAGTAGQLGERVDKAVAAFKDLGVTERQICRLLGVQEREAIDLDDYMRLRGLYTAVKEGTVTIRDLDAAPASEAPEAPSALDTFATLGQAAESVIDKIQTGAGALPPDAAPATQVDLKAYAACISQLLKVATDKKVAPEERLAVLDGSLGNWIAHVGDAGFVEQVINLAAKVVNGQYKEAEAKRLMEAMVP